MCKARRTHAIMEMDTRLGYQVSMTFLFRTAGATNRIQVEKHGQKL